MYTIFETQKLEKDPRKEEGKEGKEVNQLEQKKRTGIMVTKKAHRKINKNYGTWRHAAERNSKEMETTKKNFSKKQKKVTKCKKKIVTKNVVNKRQYTRSTAYLHTIKLKNVNDYI